MCKEKMTTYRERGWVVFTAKKEVTDCMSFPIEFKNLSITFFKKVDTRHDTPFWSYTQFLLNVICCYYWMIDCSVILKLLLSTQKNESMCWWVTTRSKIWHPTEWCSARNWNANEISISLIRWKQPIFLRYCTTCMSLLQQSLSHFLLLSSFQLEHDLSFHENHTFFLLNYFKIRVNFKLDFINRAAWPQFSFVSWFLMFTTYYLNY